MTSDSPGEMPAKKRERLFDHHMWWIVALAIGGVFVYQTFKYQAFPAASIDIKMPRLEIQDRANLIAPTLGYTKKDPIESTIFENDDSAKTFLEHEYTQEKANKLMATEIPVWYWKTNLCKEFEQEDFTTWISPQGKLVSFDRDVPNDAALKSVTHDEALKIARTYFESNDPEAAKFTTLIRDETFTKPKREDHSFTWEDPATDYKSAHMRCYVYISGDQITQYNKYLHVPDKWEREFETMRSYNRLFGQFAFFFIYLFQTTGFLLFVWGVITKNLRWRPAFFGALLLGGIAALDYLNQIPALISNYSPTVAFRDYIVKLVLTALLGFCGNAITGLFLFGGAEIVYRKLFPKKIAFEKMLTKAGLTHESFVRGVIVGHFVVAIHLGWIVLYYVAGKQLNFWCPLGVESHEVLSNVVPFISAVALGVSASFEEELACRVIGLGIGTKLFKNFWIANLFQAVVWGFAHSSYPQEPAYARGLELTVIGLLQGWILRRYGIIACITSHYLVDSFMYVEAFLYSDVPALKLSVIPALIPWIVIVSAAFLLKPKKVFETGDQLDNEQIPIVIPPPPPVEETPPPVKYTPLTNRVRGSLLVIFLLGIVGTSVFPWHSGINRDGKLSISRDEAITRAREVMNKHKIDPKDWMESPFCSANSIGDTFQYIFEKTDVNTTKTIFDQTRRGFYWGVRFFKPLVSEQYVVYLDGKGNETTFDITREEDDEGASLTPEEARKLAEQYVLENHPEFKDFRFKQVSTKKRKNRIDYTVEFTYPKLKVAEADCRISVSVIGDQVGDFAQWWDVPDSWSFERDKRTFRDELLSHTRTICAIVLGLALLIWCYSVLKTGAIRYRLPILIACLSIPITILGVINDLPTFYSNLDTTTPLASYYAGQGVSLLSNIFARFVSVFLAVAVSLGALRIICPLTPVASYFNFVFRRIPADQPDQRKGKLELWFDAILFCYASIAFVNIVAQLKDQLSRVISPTVPVDSVAYVIDLTEVFSPVGSVLLRYFELLPMVLCAIVVVVGLTAKFAPGFLRTALFTLAVILISRSGERYWQDYVLNVGELVLVCLYFYVAVTQIGRSNFVAYALMLLVVNFLSYAVSIGGNGMQLFLPELITFASICAAPILAALAILIRTSKR